MCIHIYTHTYIHLYTYFLDSFLLEVTIIYWVEFPTLYSRSFLLTYFILICRTIHILISLVQSLMHAQLFATPWTAAYQASLSITNSQSLLKLISIELVVPPNHLILCRPLLLLPSIFPSIRVFSSESVLCIRWPKYWSFSFSISPSNEYSGLTSFRIDWFDLLAVQGTLKSLLQYHSSKHHLTRQTVGGVMSLFFNMLCRFVIAFVSRSKSLLIPYVSTKLLIYLSLTLALSPLVTISLFSRSLNVFLF